MAAKAKSLPASARAAKGAANGRTAGFRLGHRHGYHFGRCQAVLNRVPVRTERKRSLKIMYVQEGTPGFHTLDRGIAHTLGQMVEELLVVPPSAALTDIAVQFQPDAVLVLNGIFGVPNEQLAGLRANGIRTAVWLMDDPYFSDITVKTAPLYDYVFTHEINTVPFYRAHGCSHVYYLPPAISRAVVFPRFVERQYRSDVCFIGQGFPNRIAFFNKVIPGLKGIRLFMAGYGWNQLNDYPDIKQYVNLSGVLYDHNIRHYVGAKIVINLHRSPDEKGNSTGIRASSINPRTFEIAGCGTMQLTDVREELSRFYTPGAEVATFSRPEELVDRVHYYLRHEEERRRLALQSLYKTVSSHTYGHRLEEMLRIIFGE